MQALTSHRWAVYRNPSGNRPDTVRNDNTGSVVLTMLVILLPRPIILVLIVAVIVVVAVIVLIRRSWLEPRRVSTPELHVRVAQAGVIAGRDVVHNSLESPASPPHLTAGLVEVRRRRAVPLVPGERPLTPIDEEGVPSRAVVGMPAGIHPLLRHELEVVMVGDGRPTRHTLRDRRDRHASGAQPPAGGDAVAGRTWVV